MATVLGVPLTAIGGDAIGWRSTLLVIAGVATLIALAVWIIVPETPRGQRARLKEIWQILTDPVLAPAILVTAFQMAGQLATYAVTAVYLIEWLSMPAAWLPYALMTFGIGGITGNLFAMRMIDWVGPDVFILARFIGTGLVFVGLQFAPTLALAPASAAFVLLALCAFLVSKR